MFQRRDRTRTIAKAPRRCQEERKTGVFEGGFGDCCAPFPGAPPPGKGPKRKRSAPRYPDKTARGAVLSQFRESRQPNAGNHGD